jgi:hypothetical protein
LNILSLVAVAVAVWVVVVLADIELHQGFLFLLELLTL